MKSTWNNLDRIEAWKNNEMDAQTKKEFEDELLHDNALAEEVEAYNSLVKHIENYGDARTQKTIHNVVANLEKEGFFSSSNSVVKPIAVKSNFNRSGIWAMAASFVVLVVATFFLFSPTKNPLPDIAEMQFERVERLMTIDRLTAHSLANSEKGRNDSLAMALTLYGEYKFDLARMALLKYLNDYPQDHLASLYLGLAFLQESKYAKAAKHLTPLTRIEDFEFKNTAKWYASMCYTQFGKESDFNTAKLLLKELADDLSSDYTDYAKAYLNLLNKK